MVFKLALAAGLALAALSPSPLITNMKVLLPANLLSGISSPDCDSFLTSSEKTLATGCSTDVCSESCFNNLQKTVTDSAIAKFTSLCQPDFQQIAAYVERLNILNQKVSAVCGNKAQVDQTFGDILSGIVSGKDVTTTMPTVNSIGLSAGLGAGDALPECGMISNAFVPCPVNECCSQYGFCGTSELYCNEKQQKAKDIIPGGTLASAPVPTLVPASTTNSNVTPKIPSAPSKSGTAMIGASFVCSIVAIFAIML